MTKVPEPAGSATTVVPLVNRLLDAVPADDVLGRAALDLLIDLPGEVEASPAFARYLLLAADGSLKVNWAKVGFDLQAGDDELAMSLRDRALLMLAASIGADHGVRVAMGALLKHMGKDGRSLLIAALQHADGEV